MYIYEIERFCSHQRDTEWRKNISFIVKLFFDTVCWFKYFPWDSDYLYMVKVLLIAPHALILKHFVWFAGKRFQLLSKFPLEDQCHNQLGLYPLGMFDAVGVVNVFDVLSTVKISCIWFQIRSID